MRILLCPDKFKGTLSAVGVCKAIERGLLGSGKPVEVVVHPLADGGDGSLEILNEYMDFNEREICTVDALGRKITTSYVIHEKEAFIEMASASGLATLTPEERNPMFTSTVGTGMMIKDAIDLGCESINLFIGGSATNDAGMGIVHALGYRLLDKNGYELEPVGKNLNAVHTIQETILDLQGINIIVLCDVSNPMYGEDGAAITYAAQKGASSVEVLALDTGLKHYADVLLHKSNIDLQSIPGTGAAGAVAASLVALLDAELKKGFKMIADSTGLVKAIERADLVITGEGKIDHTSFQGKVVGNVLDLCAQHDTPCGLLGGVITGQETIHYNPVFQKSLVDISGDVDLAMQDPEKYLEMIGAEIMDI